jgi:hypothetical protein
LPRLFGEAAVDDPAQWRGSFASIDGGSSLTMAAMVSIVLALANACLPEANS